MSRAAVLSQITHVLKKSRTSSNAVVEGALGKYGILSIEDIIHEISTCGPQFKAVSNFLCPFKLSNPLGGSRPRKFRTFIEGGELGKREGRAMDSLVRASN